MWFPIAVLCKNFEKHCVTASLCTMGNHKGTITLGHQHEMKQNFQVFLQFPFVLCSAGMGQYYSFQGMLV